MKYMYTVTLKMPKILAHGLLWWLLCDMLFFLIHSYTYSAAIAIGLPYWQIYDLTINGLRTVTQQGLWRYCINYEPETKYTDICGSFDSLGMDRLIQPLRLTCSLFCFSIYSVPNILLEPMLQRLPLFRLDSMLSLVHNENDHLL